jgi:hypothetical protein
VTASYQKILYDAEGAIAEMLAEKDVFTAEEKRAIAMRSYLDCAYFGDIAVRQWNLRKDPLAAHLILNKGVPALCDILFLANDEYPPFEKWKVNYSYSLKWKPIGWKNKLEEITLVKDLGLDELERRRNLFMDFYYKVWGLVVGSEDQGTGLIEIEALETLKYVIQRRQRLDDFKAKYGLAHLGTEVLFRLADVKRINGDKVIVFDKARFIEEKALGFLSFPDWNKKVLKQIKIDEL